MAKFARAVLEAILTIVVTLGIIVAAFGAMFGMDELWALSGVFYIVWAAIIFVTHIAFARERRHIRLGIGVATGVAVMGVHLVMFLVGAIPVEVNVVPVVVHDFGLALVGMTVLSLVHLVIFKKRGSTAVASAAAPNADQRVDEVPPPVTV